MVAGIVAERTLDIERNVHGTRWNRASAGEFAATAGDGCP